MVLFPQASGRFQERVHRLIKQDGELEQVLKRQIGSDGSELAATFAAHVGEHSPLMKVLNPEESKGLVSAMRSAISEVVAAERECILGEFSLDNKQGALSRLVGELTEENGELKRGLADEVQNVVAEFSLDREDSALSRLVRRVEAAWPAFHLVLLTTGNYLSQSSTYSDMHCLHPSGRIERQRSWLRNSPYPCVRSRQTKPYCESWAILARSARGSSRPADRGESGIPWPGLGLIRQ